MTDTQQEINRLFKIAGHTTDGYRSIMDTLNEMMSNDKYDNKLLIEASGKAFKKCLDLRMEENKIAWGEEFKC